MPFQIRNKATKEIVSVNSGKKVWATAGHAKAAFTTSGLCRWGTGVGTYVYHGIPKGCRFDEQDKLEIIEIKYQDTDKMKEAIQLLMEAHDVLDNFTADSHLVSLIEKFLKENV